MKEVWECVPSNKNYAVSNLGRVKRIVQSAGTYVGKILNSQNHTSGYIMVWLWNRGKTKPHLVHRLVLEAFVGPCPKGYECNHRDHNKKNNILTNLHWVTHRDNILRARDEKRTSRAEKGIKGYQPKLTEGNVRKIRKRWESGESQMSIAKDYPTTVANINHIVHRKSWKHVD